MRQIVMILLKENEIGEFSLALVMAFRSGRLAECCFSLGSASFYTG